MIVGILCFFNEALVLWINFQILAELFHELVASVVKILAHQTCRSVESDYAVSLSRVQGKVELLGIQLFRAC